MLNIKEVFFYLVQDFLIVVHKGFSFFRDSVLFLKGVSCVFCIYVLCVSKTLPWVSFDEG